MCSYALACYSHSCHKYEHNSPAPVAKKVFTKDPIPLNKVKVNLSFISRLPKLLDINWKCIYVWKKVKPTKTANNNKLRKCKENKELPTQKDQGLRKSVMIEVDESLIPESSVEEEEASEDSSESELMSATIGDRARMFKERKQINDVGPPLFERKKKMGASQRRKSDEKSHCKSTMKNGVRNKQVPKVSDTTKYEFEESILRNVEMEKTDEMSVSAKWLGPTKNIKAKKIKVVKRVTPEGRRGPDKKKKENDHNKVINLLTALVAMM